MELNTYTDVWVVISYGDQDIAYIYTEKNEAEIACEEENNRIKKFKNLNTKYEVKSLSDAIDYIKSAVEDEVKYPIE